MKQQIKSAVLCGVVVFILLQLLCLIDQDLLNPILALSMTTIAVCLVNKSILAFTEMAVAFLTVMGLGFLTSIFKIMMGLLL